MEIQVGKPIWNKATKREFEIIYINAKKREGNSVVIITKKKYQHTDFIHPDVIQADFTDVEPQPEWPPKFKQRVFSIDVVGNVYGFECYEEISLPRIYPSRTAAELARDKQQLITELQEFADKENRDWNPNFNHVTNANWVIYRQDGIIGPTDLCKCELSNQAYFVSSVATRRAINHFGRRLEILF